MRSDQLTGNQLEALRERIAPMLDYVARLEVQMLKRKFPANDPLFVAVTEARNVTQTLTVEIDHWRCDPMSRTPVRPPKVIMPHSGDDPLGRKPRK